METMTTPLLQRSAPDRAEVPVPQHELAALADLARSRGARRVAIGSGRTARALAFADEFAAVWEATGGEVVDAITWPETAASWLRQATRFAGAGADLWIMTGPAAGWAQMTRRLLWSTRWRPEHALVTATIGSPETLELVGLWDLDGLAGVSSQGTPWTVREGRLIFDEA
ncbi:hypothetical protein ABZU75_24735 [Streptosporangium sp. NPDC005286]|uniref:hypothetical protein n=1 Tax=Streptosporangium sp. NPDC005286 TaxID=3154463 RepID=UPI0033B92DEB